MKLKNIKKIILNPHLVLVRLSYNCKRFLSDIRAYFGKYNYKYNIIFIAGMPYSGSTLTKNMFGLIPGYYTRHTPMPDQVHFNQNISDSAFKNCPKWGFTIFKTHLNPLEKNINIIRNHNVKKVVVPYRAPRDVAISRYHRQLKWPKKSSEPHYMDYSKLDKEEAVNHSISVVVKELVPWINGWIEISKKYNNFVHFCKFESLKKFQEKEFSKMLEFYNIFLPKNKILEIINIIDKTKDKVSMEKNMYQAALLPWALATNFRSGKIGQWKQEFTDNNKNYFKKISGNYLIEKGYEKDNNW